MYMYYMNIFCTSRSIKQTPGASFTNLDELKSKYG